MKQAIDHNEIKSFLKAPWKKAGFLFVRKTHGRFRITIQSLLERRCSYLVYLWDGEKCIEGRNYSNADRIELRSLKLALTKEMKIYFSKNYYIPPQK